MRQWWQPVISCSLGCGMRLLWVLHVTGRSCADPRGEPPEPMIRVPGRSGRFGKGLQSVLCVLYFDRSATGGQP